MADKELVEIGEAKAFIEANWPNDPLLRQIVLNLLKKLPRAKEQRKPETRADQIRAMSDVELAQVIMCPEGMSGQTCKGEEGTSCVACCLRWLKQPAGDV